jgi:hypothetical protein
MGGLKMSYLEDIYARQIANARAPVQGPSQGNRPIFSGMILNNEEPGYGDIGAALGQGIGKYVGGAYLKPRMQATANEYSMENDPQVLYKRAAAAAEMMAKMPPELKSQVEATPGHQELVAKVAEKFPELIQQDANGMHLAVRQPSLDEQRAKEVPASAVSDRAKEAALTAESVEKTRTHPSESAATVNLHNAQAEYYRAGRGSEKRADERAALQEKKLDAQAQMQFEKQTMDAYHKGVAQSRKVIDEKLKLGVKPDLNTRVEVNAGKADATISLVQSLGSEHPISSSKANESITELYDTFVKAMLPDEDKRFAKWVRSGMYSPEQLTTMNYIVNKAIEVASSTKGNVDQTTSQKLAWMNIMISPTTSEADKERLKTWRQVTKEDAVKLFRGGK